MNGEAAKAAGFAYGAYGRLKFSLVVERLAGAIASIGGHDQQTLRAALWQLAGDANNPEAALAKGGAGCAFVLFLRRFDLDFRIRRLRFMIRRINAAMAGADDDTVAALGRIKAGLHHILAPHLTAWTKVAADPAVQAACSAPDLAAALAAVEAALGLKALDSQSDAALVALLAERLPRRLRRDVLSSYLGFPFFDIAILPLIADGGLDELDEIKVDRISPDDCSGLGTAGGRRLKGALFNAFGAFFSRSYREHDYLWGRLHGAERMIDLVISSLPEAARPSPGDLAGIRDQVFGAIIAAERPHLQHIDDLFADLDATLTRPAGASGALKRKGDTGADNG